MPPFDLVASGSSGDRHISGDHMHRSLPALTARARSRRARLAGVVALAVAATAAGAATSATGAVARMVEPPGSSAACPLAYTGGFADGQAVEGLTTTRGTAPESFAGTYLDTIPDGIARGRDMLVFRLSGSRITGAGGGVDAGIWAGISGSPVYDPGTGALVGAVSYGRSWANDVIAGVTPAADMYGALLSGRTSSAPAAPRVVGLPPAARSTLASEGVPVSASSTLRRLDSPTYVSGVSPEVARAIGRKAGRTGTTYRAGVAAAPTGPDLPIVAGGNIATSWSHGDVTSAGLGSVTAVCGDQVLAYGHPDTFSGDSQQSVHGARALNIDANGGYESFKDLAEIGAPVGSLDQDRLEGVVGTLGTLPVSADLRTTTAFGGAELAGHSVITQMDTLADVVAMQVYDDTVTAMNAGYPEGEALLRWTISFTRAGGAPETFTRSQRYSTRIDLPYDVTSDVAADVWAIQDNPFRDVAITGIELTNALTGTYRAHRLGRVEVLQGGHWRRVRNNRTISAPRGRDLVVRAHFPRADRWSDVRRTTRTMRFPIAWGASGKARLRLKGNHATWDDFDFFGELDDEFFDVVDDSEIFFGGEPGPARGKAHNLTQLLAQLQAQPRQDDVTGSLSYRNRRADDGISVKSRQKRLPAVVRGSFRMQVRVR